MALKYVIVLLSLVSLDRVESANFLEMSYDYIWSLGKSLAPNFMNMFDCIDHEDLWECTREKAGKMLESWKKDVEKERSNWQMAADEEVKSLGRSYTEVPSKLGQEVESSLTSLADLLQRGIARALTRRRENVIDTITITTSESEKRKIRRKKQKPPKIHLVTPSAVTLKKGQRKGRGFQNSGEVPVQSWVIGYAKSIEQQKQFLSDDGMQENSTASTEESSTEIEIAASNGRPRGLMQDIWSMGERGVDALAEHLVEAENSENGIKSENGEEQRGKKKKKKALLLKLLILGAVLKAKIATLLQILSFKLQVKFFLIALIGLAINLARFWLELKNKHHQQPQKIIYYEHAQHQHHYDHEEEPGWGPWSRAIHPEEAIEENEDTEVDFPASPYRAYEKIAYARPTLTRG